SPDSCRHPAGCTTAGTGSRAVRSHGHGTRLVGMWVAPRACGDKTKSSPGVYCRTSVLLEFMSADDTARRGGIYPGVDVSSKDSVNSFGARDTLKVGDKSYEIYRLDAVPGTEKLPYSLKVLAENLLRTEDGANIRKDHIEAIA